ncbi:aminotransferase class V-fold PLP-dependent enzyme [Paenarthrobacter sp. NPDC089322]|uniref:aminotransferase class V-fold PLP-dependent enzyme n=1 Tax=Paenarthrobacter sp. NPDC089322 TaxID=3155065 RepID=UPI003443CD42
MYPASNLTAPRPMMNPDGAPSSSDWSLAPSKVHLNHGSYGSVPRAAQEYQLELKARMEANPCTWFMGQYNAVAAARTDVAAFLGVEAQDVALVQNASAGISAVYNSLALAPGSEIVMTNHAYGAVLHGAYRVARKHGGRVRVAEVPLDADAVTATSLVMAEVSDRTALIVVDQITSATARAFPVEAIAEAASAMDVPVLVDGAHAPGIVELPVPSFDGFWVGNLHKFACAPRGTAALVARGERAGTLTPLIDSWGFPHSFPENFDHVGTQDVTSWMAARKSFDTISERYGWETFRTYATALCDYGESLISTAFADLTGQDHTVEVGMPVGPMRLLRLPEGLATTHEDSHNVRAFISEELDIESAVTTFNGEGFLRLSAHLYNSPKDFEIFAGIAVPELVRLARSL